VAAVGRGIGNSAIGAPALRGALLEAVGRRVSSLTSALWRSRCGARDPSFLRLTEGRRRQSPAHNTSPRDGSSDPSFPNSTRGDHRPSSRGNDNSTTVAGLGSLKGDRARGVTSKVSDELVAGTYEGGLMGGDGHRRAYSKRPVRQVRSLRPARRKSHGAHRRRRAYLRFFASNGVHATTLRRQSQARIGRRLRPSARLNAQRKICRCGYPLDQHADYPTRSNRKLPRTKVGYEDPQEVA